MLILVFDPLQVNGRRQRGSRDLGPGRTDRFGVAVAAGVRVSAYSARVVAMTVSIVNDVSPPGWKTAWSGGLTE
jgi:hypothetical protein